MPVKCQGHEWKRSYGKEVNTTSQLMQIVMGSWVATPNKFVHQAANLKSHGRKLCEDGCWGDVLRANVDATRFMQIGLKPIESHLCETLFFTCERMSCSIWHRHAFAKLPPVHRWVNFWWNCWLHLYTGSHGLIYHDWVNYKDLTATSLESWFL